MVTSPRTFLADHDPETGVSTLTLNRPERLNALTFEVYAAA
jgi:enoyl-CoA hydratase/carnithine racemase